MQVVVGIQLYTTYLNIYILHCFCVVYLTKSFFNDKHVLTVI